MTQPEVRTHTVYDGQRTLNVHGELLGEADSQTGTNTRWTELALYRTDSGRYVLEKVGRSDVYHSADCSQTSKGGEHPSLGDDNLEQDRSYAPCPRCRPGPDPRPVFVERDIHSAVVYSTIEEVLDALYRPGSDNVRFLSRVARDLLDAASRTDPRLFEVLDTPIEVT